MATLKIPVNEDNIEKIFEAERLLRELGITFDTGYGCGVRDWELDWSLKGAYLYPHKGEKLNDFNQEEINQTLYSAGNSQAICVR
jgi:aminopeptidase-like protein